MMIDSVVWAQHIHVTDTQALFVTDSHVAIANAALHTGVVRQKSKIKT